MVSKRCVTRAVRAPTRAAAAAASHPACPPPITTTSKQKSRDRDPRGAEDPASVPTMLILSGSSEGRETGPILSSPPVSIHQMLREDEAYPDHNGSESHP